MSHLADVGVREAFTIPDVDPLKAREAATDLLRTLGVEPDEAGDQRGPWCACALPPVA